METKIRVLPNKFSNEDGSYNLKEALLFSSKVGGMCYLQGNFNSLENEPIEKSVRRLYNTMDSGHHSVYDHLYINLEIEGLSKIVAMILNNEKEYTTSEKSARYTHIDSSTGVSEDEVRLYDKWSEIFIEKITELYGDTFDEKKIYKLAQENARYMVSIFMPTKMVYSTSLRQINYMYHWFNDYINNAKTDIEIQVSEELSKFNNELVRQNLVITNLQRIFPNDKKGDVILSDGKGRKISLFKDNFLDEEEIYSNVYSMKYKASAAYLAQAQRHRTLSYQMILHNGYEYYIPEIIKDNPKLVAEWLTDIKSVSHLYPQGMLFNIIEKGTYENFLLKCKERICSFAQLEINDVTRQLLKEYAYNLNTNNHPLKEDIKRYLKGARCTFPNYECNGACKFKEGINLTRKI